MPKFFGRRSNSGFVGPFGSFFGCFALIAAGAGAGFLLGACEGENDYTHASVWDRASHRDREPARRAIASTRDARLGLDDRPPHVERPRRPTPGAHAPANARERWMYLYNIIRRRESRARGDARGTLGTIRARVDRAPRDPNASPSRARRAPRRARSRVARATATREVTRALFRRIASLAHAPFRVARL